MTRLIYGTILNSSFLQIKRAALNELIDHITTTKGAIVESIYPEVIKMVSKNIFRVLPPSDNSEFDPEEDEPTLEVSWPHLQVGNSAVIFIFTFCIILLCNLMHFSTAFLYTRLILSMEWENYLKSLEGGVDQRHLLYFIRRKLYHLNYSIINGFALPLKQEHKVFLVKVLLPLHKP
ncbi:unnamed protein product, partial [Cylicostephanus goldi]